MLVAGQLLHNRYQVVRSLKAGGMGAVYEAQDRERGDEPCAVKEVREELLEGDDASFLKERFEREVKILSSLQHPGIPAIRDAFLVGQTQYLVMEFIAGESLDQDLKDQGPLTPEAVAQCAREVLAILEYLHALQPPLLHRDIKPANLIREEHSGKVWLVDFGLARDYRTDQEQTMVGTMGFAAPEQTNGKAEPRSDLYSLAVSMYVLLTGAAPRVTRLEAMQAKMPDYRPGLALIISTAAAPRVEDRYPDAQAMKAALDAWLPEPALRRRLWPAFSGRTLAWVMLVALVLLTGLYLTSDPFDPLVPRPLRFLRHRAASPRPTPSPAPGTPAQ